ncbi:hypothetical protein L1987_36632 [Smallanthus sonchifolius]|uniref:Uncharacterized protein n=1 Tax=Smallanthus sonchifolius TaxID=185202 RepID=A0ACB9HGL8_9ASTR|nr:hypothetical protein L1987_36632 [Smallanthus sonchifolius]
MKRFSHNRAPGVANGDLHGQGVGREMSKRTRRVFVQRWVAAEQKLKLLGMCRTCGTSEAASLSLTCCSLSPVTPPSLFCCRIGVLFQVPDPFQQFFMDQDSTHTARESLDLVFEMSNIVDTGLDRHTLSVLIALCDLGLNPEALAAVVKEFRSEPPFTSSTPSTN